ncbi:putative cytochrome P450 E-class, group IV [Naviculisporaceae sp. PSN 640]
MASSPLLVDSLRQYVPLSPLNIGLVAAGLLLIYAFITANRNANRAPALKDPIPYVYNAYQYMTDQPAFLNRVRNALKNQPIVSFHVGPLKFYMVKSPKSIQALFRTSPSVSSNKFMHMIFENMMNFAPHDTARFDDDLSGRLPTPLPLPTTNKPSKRYWAPYHAILHNYLARAHETNKLGLTYQKFFGERLEKYKIGEWVEDVKIRDFLYRDMFIAATTAFCGPRMLALNPDLIDVFWKHHEIAASLVYGLPRFLNKRALNIREQFHGAAKKYLEGAELFPKEGEKERENEGDWDEVWGSSVNRELCRFFAREGFEMRSQAGALCVTNVFGSNANSIPICVWMLMYTIRDPVLFASIREEVESVLIIDPSSGNKTLDLQKMLALPLLQSVYIECLRMHMSINVTREVVEPTMFEGYLIEKGAIIQGPAEIIHYEEENWGKEGHPASEFWAERHVKYVDSDEADATTGEKKKVRQFAMSGRAAEFIPYGGGVSMCPGRFFAKQEMLMTVALMVSRFDIEFLEWTHLEDGSHSDRPAQNHAAFIGGAAVPPDRDMKVRWKRLW